jgi:phage baseplate assembly protein gpV
VYHPGNGNELEAMAMRKLFGKYRGSVEDNADPEGLGRLQVVSPAALGSSGRAWAMPSLPCVPCPEPGVGFSMLPPIGAEVWVEFEEGDPDRPIVTGCLWDSRAAPPSTADDVILTTPSGHRLVLSEARNEVSVSHPGGSSVKLDAAGRIELSASSTIRMTAAKVELEAGMVQARGVVKCDSLLATSVVASSYTPGAGNAW